MMLLQQRAHVTPKNVLKCSNGGKKKDQELLDHNYFCFGHNAKAKKTLQIFRTNKIVLDMYLN